MPRTQRALLRLFATLSMAALSLGMMQTATAQDAYPSKPVKLIIPGGAGSGPDTLARVITAKLAERWGQAVVAENVPGVGGNLGHERVAKSAGDGYTLLLGMIGPMAINPNLQGTQLGFDPVKDLVPVSMIARYPNLLVVHPSVPATTLQELLAYARANPGKLRYGMPGLGTTPHLSGVMLSSMADIKMLEVPYKSSTQMTTDLIAGHIDLMFLNPAAVLPHVKSGALRAIAITSKTRQPYAPELPTMIEAGVPDYEVSSWYGVFAPAGTPPAVIAKLNADLLKVMAMPDVRVQFSMRGDEPFAGSPDQAGQYVRAENAKWKEVIRTSNIKRD
ncbi:MAG TPA: tripartite tricarboxylate transporter substrate binding protein [Bordetella sp.]|nr:tripartite tricarboxylate transporter substrate binding protein [Bordetella sp.]